MVYLCGFLFVFSVIFAVEYSWNNPMRFIGIHDDINLSIEDTRDFKIFELEWQLSHQSILRDVFAAWEMNEKCDMEMSPIYVEEFITRGIMKDMELVPNIKMFEPYVRKGVAQIVQQYDWI